jgi:hypothetical protein
MCCLGIEDWARSLHAQAANTVIVSLADTCLFVCDETKDVTLRKQLKQSFRILRRKRPASNAGVNRLWHAHDDMYFGDSRDSVGLQMADICNYFMLRHLKNSSDSEFYDLFSAQAICAKPEPEWSTNRGLFRIHDS